MKKIYSQTIVLSLIPLFWGSELFSQNIAVNTSGAAAGANNMFEVTQTSTAANMVALYAIHNGATGAGISGYGFQAIKTGATGINIAGYFSASGGGSNYAILVPSTGGSVGIGTITPGYKLDVTGGAIGGTYGLTPKYATWNLYGVGDGGAAIYNDNVSYQTLMLVGNNSAGGSRRVSVWDYLTVNGNTTITGLAGTGTRMVQANASGALLALTAGTASDVLLGTGVWGGIPAGSGNYIQNQFAAAQVANHWVSGSSRALEVYAGSWFRNDATGTGLYNQVNGRHFYSQDANYWSLTTGNGLIFRDAYASTVQGYVYNDGTNFGILHRGGGWGFGSSTTRSFVNQSLMVNGTGAPSYALHTIGDIYANGGWFRVSGNQGLYFESWGGGWYMLDGTWIRNYNAKPLYINSATRTWFNTSSIRITDGTQGAGKVLTSDASGNSSWQTPASSAGWLLVGNAGTADATNFVGTTDNVPLNFRVNNQKSGRMAPVDLNTSYGYQSLLTGTGYGCVAIGHEALKANVRTNDALAIGWGNVCVGYQALLNNTEGQYNTTLGNGTLQNNTIGLKNAAMGNVAGAWNTTGNYNVGFGCRALIGNSTGSQNVAVGYQSGWGYSITNSICIGYTAGGWWTAGTNHVEIGTGSNTWIGGQVGWTTASDARIKDNVKENVPGLDFITRLQPVTYNFNLHRQIEMMERNTGKKDTVEWPEKYDIEKIKFSGFLAQDVEKAAKEIGYDFSGVCAPANPNGLYSLRYSEFVMPLVKSVQELNAKNEAQQKEINELKGLVIKLLKHNDIVIVPQASTSLEVVENNTNIKKEKTLVKDIGQTPAQYEVSDPVPPINNSSGKIIISGPNFSPAPPQ